MKVTVITGTQVMGCTYAIKNLFLEQLTNKLPCEITEFYLPKACPAFCLGCKSCFTSDIDRCPHANYTVPIWDAIESADLLVFASPTYAMHTTAQTKALLDHFCSRWMAHSPRGKMFCKQAVILSHAIGAGMKGTAKDIKDSLDFWGVARTYVVCQGLGEGDFAAINPKTKKTLLRKLSAAVRKIDQRKNRVTPCFKSKMLFYSMKFAQIMINRGQLSKGNPSTKDYLHWKQNGWLDKETPWRQA